ncbi:hypothetical protein HZH66_012508 [Vespula vulgaris]|uniref:Secreted protein n=1 Tax=Vespula vulgaris TaxID=7454 RepID=A0A834MVA3_VESVU|nr:hypothetical protein HZH66_012508 [Vespula vulgaris]
MFYVIFILLSIRTLFSVVLCSSKDYSEVTAGQSRDKKCKRYYAEVDISCSKKMLLVLLVAKVRVPNNASVFHGLKNPSCECLRFFDGKEHGTSPVSPAI